MYEYIKPEDRNFKRKGLLPSWHVPPGFKPLKVFSISAVLLGISAIPVWGLPWSEKSSEEDAKRKKEEDFYMRMKKKNRDERYRWINSDDMPVR
mmetsp:Transcript_19446/g.35092  ORF Transcript_19446/g.35092 Transcript_19446/m.35092 type:complete len:94 (+) Transcript_19446:57-338(+)